MSYLRNKPIVKNYKQEGVVSVCLNPPKMNDEPIAQVNVDAVQEAKDIFSFVGIQNVEFVDATDPNVDVKEAEPVAVQEEINAHPTKYLSAIDLLKLRAK